LSSHFIEDIVAMYYEHALELNQASLN